MKILKQLLSTLLIVCFLGIVSTVRAQRYVRYSDLVMRSQQQPVSFDFITLPGDKENTVKFTSVFSLSYSYLPFKKMNQGSSGEKFYSTVSLSLEVFKADKSQNKKRRKNENISVEGLEPAGRAFWSDTAFAQDYETSQSHKEFLKGHLDVTLEPGTYDYVMQLKRGEETDSRISRTQVVHIEPYDKMKVGNVILGEKLITEKNPPQFKLNSMGQDVEYAKDFYALAYIPAYEKGASYTLKINSLNIAEKDTNKLKETYSEELATDDIRAGLHPKMASAKSPNFLNLVSSDKGYTYALVKIPNSNFPNSFYRLKIEKEGQKQPVAQGTFRSLWIDMPASLYNLDVAIDMLRYIADKETIKRLSDGTQAQREQKFRAFWKERDPTPKTEFNELMAEYYRRIDYAYKNFSSETQPGYDSDQGRIYIKFGPPVKIDRKFPTNGPTTEIWTYNDRQFIFKATSGFGDFKLISNESK